MDAKIAALGARTRRPGHDTTVRVRHQKPQQRLTKKQLAAREREREQVPQYPGWVPSEKECRREECTNTFLPAAPAQAYCCTDCRDEAVRGQRRITDKRKREKRKQRRQVERGDWQTPRECGLDNCTVRFVPEHPKSRYCSPEHRDEALRSQKARSARRHYRPAVSPDTQQVIAEIDALEERMGERLPELGRDYLVILWQRVNSDPACPQHIYDRLERLLGLPAEGGSTMQPVDAR